VGCALDGKEILLKRGNPSQLNVADRIAAALGSPPKASSKHVRTRAVEALLFHTHSNEHYELAERLTNCQKRWTKELAFHRRYPQVPTLLEVGDSSEKWFRGRYLNPTKHCQSLWCKQCRKVAGKTFKGRIIDRLGKRLLNGSYQNDDLKHITAAVGVCDFTVEDVQRLVSSDDDRWRRIRYRLQKLVPISAFPFLECVYEFELVDWAALETSTDKASVYKKRQMRQLIQWCRPSGDKVVFVHFHGITNLDLDQLKAVFSDEYWVNGKPLIKTHPSIGLYVQRLHKGKSLEDNLEKLTSYSFKSAYRYKHSFIGSDYTNGEYISPSDLSKLVTLYQVLQKRNWRGLFRSASNKIADEIGQYKAWYYESDVDQGQRRHPIWSNWIDLFPESGVFIVDRFGETHTKGWNPNNVLVEGRSTFDFHFVERIVVDKTRFYHPDFPWLKVYKNVWKEVVSDHLPYANPSKLDAKMDFDQFYGVKSKRKLERHWGKQYVLRDPSAYDKKKVRRKLFHPVAQLESGDILIGEDRIIDRWFDEVRRLDAIDKFLGGLGDAARAERIRKRLHLRESIATEAGRRLVFAV
jgi:hypothetical protein